MVSGRRAVRGGAGRSLASGDPGRETGVRETALPHRRATRDQRGAVAVEAALVLPILFTMLFGIVELSLLVRDKIVDRPRRPASAARIATTGGRRRAGHLPDGPDRAGVHPGELARRSRRPRPTRSSAPGMSMPKELDRLHPGLQGQRQGLSRGRRRHDDADRRAPGTTDCVMFKWKDAADAFRYASGTWASKTINACVNEADTVGIYLRATHNWVTGLFGDGRRRRRPRRVEVRAARPGQLQVRRSPYPHRMSARDRPHDGARRARSGRRHRGAVHLGLLFGLCAVTVDIARCTAEAQRVQKAADAAATAGVI